MAEPGGAQISNVCSIRGRLEGWLCIFRHPCPAHSRRGGPERRLTREAQAAADAGAASEMVAVLLTASRVLVATSARALAAADETLTMPRFRMLVVLGNAGPTNLAGLAERLAVNPSTATRMVD